MSYILPIPLNPCRLDDGSGIEDTLIKNKAKYHNLCKLKFNKTKLTRAAERTKATGATENETRRDFKRFHIETKDAICFICERNDRLEYLRQVMTLECGRKLTEIATVIT